MNSGHTPLQPQKDSWKKKVHDEVFKRQRIVYDPNSFTTITPFGVIHRPRPVDESSGGSDGPYWL